jgi:hypothetical protein
VRKFLPFLLVFSLIYNIGGDYVWFRFLQSEIVEEIAHEIRMGMKAENLSLIILSKNEEANLCWIKQNKEFIYKGDMFDVVSIKIQHQKKYIQCYKDVREKKLITDFNKNHDSKKEAELKTKKLSNIQFFQQNFSLVNNSISTDILYYYIVNSYRSNFVFKHFPPPKIT